MAPIASVRGILESELNVLKARIDKVDGRLDGLHFAALERANIDQENSLILGKMKDDYDGLRRQMTASTEQFQLLIVKVGKLCPEASW